MSGYLKLISTGIQDLELIKNPEINLFQYKYFRYVNFATEMHKQHLNETVGFGKNKVTIDIKKTGHLLSKIYLNIKLPILVLVDGTYACWADTLGYAIFSKPIELVIGGIIVDRLYGTGLDMMDELKKKIDGKNLMILKSDIYRSAFKNATKVIDLMIPLDFWFTKDYSLALPLIAMTSQEISLNFYFRDFSDVINYDGVLGPNQVSILDSYIYTEYIYLDEIILETYQKQSFKYVIEQMVYHGDENIPSNQTIFQAEIDFNNPCKELLFACIDINNIDNNNYFNYSKRSNGDSLITEASLLLNGKHLFNDYLPESVFRQIFPNSIHSVIPNKHMYCIPFSIKPEDATQPTGSINLSRFDSVTLALKLKSGNPECQLHIYGIVHNIVTISNGTLTFEFVNV